MCQVFKITGERSLSPVAPARIALRAGAHGQRALHGVAQFARQHRLGHAIHGTPRQGFAGDLLAAVSGHQNHRDRGEPLIIFVLRHPC